MNYKQRAKAWFAKALGEDDEFDKFILLYIAFEVSAKETHRQIRAIKNDIKLKNSFFRSLPAKQVLELKTKLDSDPLQNMNPIGDNRWSGKLRNDSDFEGIIEFIIRARNNLFHGDKDLEIERDLFIIRWGNAFLEPLVGALLDG
jgi:hypothetical protein